MGLCTVLVTRIAAIAHAANKALCYQHCDLSQVDWAEAPKSQTDSAEAGVRAIADHPNITPEELHQAWREHKIANGWTWGETKDVEKKCHPNLLPFEELPPEQQLKDKLFGSIVRTLLTHHEVIERKCLDLSDKLGVMPNEEIQKGKDAQRELERLSSVQMNIKWKDSLVDAVLRHISYLEERLGINTDEGISPQGLEEGQITEPPSREAPGEPTAGASPKSE